MVSPDTVVELTARIAALEAQLMTMTSVSDPSRNLMDGFGFSDGRRLDTTATHAWLLVCGMLVMLMQAGFALIEAGVCREKNVQSVLMKNVLDCCVGTLAWYAIGWTLAYAYVGDGADGLTNCDYEQPDDYAGGFSGLLGGDFGQAFGKGFLVGSKDDLRVFKDCKGDDMRPESMTDDKAPAVLLPQGQLFLDWFFQWAFCNAAATIVSGGVAERMQIGGYVFFTFMMTGVIYPVVVAWTWSGNGWLAYKGPGYLDFAGSGIVHLTGGIGALVGAIILGKRKGRFEEGVDQSEFDPHNQLFIVLGTFILWFGWYGFNCGSTLAMDETSGKVAAMVAMNTTLSASAGGFGAAMISFLVEKKWNLPVACGGILAGLVSITAGCGNVLHGSAVAIGLLGSLVFYGTSRLLKKLQIDDPIDAFAVHGACGIWGTMCVALFDFGIDGWSGASWDGAVESADSVAARDAATKACEEAGTELDACTLPDVAYWGMSDILAVNLLGLLCITLWSGGLCAIIFSGLKALGKLRIEESIEQSGMDAAEFASPKAYNVQTWPANPKGAEAAEENVVTAVPAPKLEA